MKNLPFTIYHLPFISNRNSKINSGVSLLEILVVVSIFAVLGILITRSIILTLSGSKKSESIIKVRENLNYSLGVMERQLRNANSVETCESTLINYSDQNGNASTFSCNDMDTIGYVASGSSRLTNTGVDVIACTFDCNNNSGRTSLVEINLEAKDASASGEQNTDVTASTKVFLRNY